MSYDVTLTVDTGGQYPARVTETRTPTYNLGPMFEDALGFPLRNLNGLKGLECVPLLRVAIAAMQDDPARFKKLNPENGWGSYEGALKFFQGFLEECIEHPKAIVSV